MKAESTVLRVLLIDDEETVRAALKQELEEQAAHHGDGNEWRVHSQGFDKVTEALAGFRPDMVVLDLMEGPASEETVSGNRSFVEIRDNWFCPIIVYTGFAARRDFEEHPQVVQVTKGMGSDEHVLAKLKSFIPVARMIRAVHEDFDSRIREALRDSVQTLIDQIDTSDNDSMDSILPRAVRRQVAARVDLAASESFNLHSWERLLVPPLGNDLLTADLLRRSNASCADPAAFRLILTPSCDLVSSGNRRPKVDRVLVARCEPLSKLGKMQFSPGAPLTEPQKKSLRSVLTEGLSGEHFVVPEFRNHVPLMVANLKRLEFVEWDRVDIGGGENGADGQESEWVRVASTDSPFRELAVWAYLRVTGRPGMPEIDIDRWVSEISSRLEASPEE